MTRLIDADELKEWVENWLKIDHYYHPYASCNNIPINELEDIIERMPTVDAVPVVRCKDCKYSHKCGGDMVMRSAGGGYIYCPLGADGYCSKGERKEE